MRPVSGRSGRRTDVRFIGPGVDKIRRLGLDPASFPVTRGLGHDPAYCYFGLPRVTEEAAAALREQGVRVSVVRVPQVHDRSKQGVFMRFI